MRSDTIRLLNPDETFKKFISPGDLEDLEAKGEVEPSWWKRSDGRQFQGYKLKGPKVMPSTSGHSPTAISEAECLASVGLPKQPGGFVTRERQEEVQEKVAMFGDYPSWKYLTMAAPQGWM